LSTPNQEGYPERSQPKAITPTGIPALDESIGGGLQRGSLILLAGTAGSGKTLFASRFLYEGARLYGEKGIYVSFQEPKTTFTEFMKRFGYDFPKLEKEGMERILDYPTFTEQATPLILTRIVEEVQRIQAKRLVIDSFTALSTCLPDKLDSRAVLHDIFSKITRALNCTTLLVIERPIGSESIGDSIEEFVADAVLILRHTEFDQRPLRILEVRKTRGQKILTTKMHYTLDRGFEAYTPPKEPPPTTQKWRTIPDSEDRFSTGSQDLDKLLGGGYPRGSYALIDIGEDIPDTIRHLFTIPIMLNFLSQSRGVTVVPRPNSNAQMVKNRLARHIEEEKIKQLLRVYEKSGYTTDPAISVPYQGVNPERDNETYIESWEELKRRTEGRPVLRIVAADTDEYTYGLTGVIRTATNNIARTAIQGDLGIAIAAPHLECTRHLSQLSHTHLRMREHYGNFLIYGVRPRTAIHIGDIDTSRGAPELKLDPVR
jgi:KaiC/GvpD/RAD55 family RecA-like ATPase